MSAHPSKIQVIHFADPWCFWSWALEPVLQRLRAVYGENIEIIYRMGGVFDNFRDWQQTYGVDDAGTIEWIKSAGEKSDHPQNPTYMTSCDVKTSYRSCMAVKAAELQDAHKAEKYFRRLMEVFQIEAKDPTDDVLMAAAADVGLDAARLTKDIDTQDIEQAFVADKHAMRTMGVNFLSLVVVVGDKAGSQAGLFHAAPFEKFIDELAPGLRQDLPESIEAYMGGMKGHYVHAHEVAEVFQISDEDALSQLEKLHGAGMVDKKSYDFADYWLPK